jgi:hypothetical protein
MFCYPESRRQSDWMTGTARARNAEILHEMRARTGAYVRVRLP